MARRPRLSLLGPVLLACVLCGHLATPAAAAPQNDDFADAVTIRLGETIRGTTHGATMQPGERARPVDYERSVWYRFRSTRRVSVLLTATCPPPDAQEDRMIPAISVYSGRSVRSIRIIDFNEGNCPGPGARVSFTALPARTFRIAITTFADDEEAPAGPIRLRADEIDAPANDDFSQAARLVPGSSVVATTRNATLELGEMSSGEPRSVWFKLRLARSRNVSLKLTWPGRSCLDDLPYLGVHTGRTVSSLTEVRYSEYDNTSESGTCTYRFNARSRVTYHVQIAQGGKGRQVRLSTR